MCRPESSPPKSPRDTINTSSATSPMFGGIRRAGVAVWAALLPGSTRSSSSSRLQTCCTPLAKRFGDRYSPTQPADGAVGLLSADPAPVLGIELHLARPGSREASLGEMLELRDESGNASWLSSRCLYCIAEGPFALRGVAQEKGRRCLSTSDEEWRPSLGRPLTRHLRWDPFAPCQ